MKCKDGENTMITLIKSIYIYIWQRQTDRRLGGGEGGGGASSDPESNAITTRPFP